VSAKRIGRHLVSAFVGRRFEERALLSILRAQLFHADPCIFEAGEQINDRQSLLNNIFIYCTATNALLPYCLLIVFASRWGTLGRKRGCFDSLLFKGDVSDDSFIIVLCRDRDGAWNAIHGR
jgi:hypothetical protein